MTVPYKRNVRPEREAKAMTDITYDSEVDAMYIALGRSKIERTEEPDAPRDRGITDRIPFPSHN
jgi:hypothetical protein